MLDDELGALWRKDVERERNPAFELVLMRRMEHALLRRAIVLNFVGVAVASLLLAYCAPPFTVLWQQTVAHFVSAPLMAFLLMALSILLSKMFRANVP